MVRIRRAMEAAPSTVNSAIYWRSFNVVRHLWLRREIVSPRVLSAASCAPCLIPALAPVVNSSTMRFQRNLFCMNVLPKSAQIAVFEPKYPNGARSNSTILQCLAHAARDRWQSRHCAVRQSGLNASRSSRRSQAAVHLKVRIILHVFINQSEMVGR